MQLNFPNPRNNKISHNLMGHDNNKSMSVSLLAQSVFEKETVG